jgi:hypothetical protein
MGTPWISIHHPAFDKPMRFCLSMTEFSDGYSVTLKRTPRQGRTHFHTIQWDHGEVNDLELTFKLAVIPEGDGIQSPLQVVTTVAKFFTMALPTTGSTPTLQTGILVIGGDYDWWFLRSGLVKDVKVKWQEPWDTVCGAPHRAEVKLTWAAHYTFDSRYPNKKAISPQRPWDFGKNWGSRALRRFAGGYRHE